jgi:hypothetical protein
MFTSVFGEKHEGPLLDALLRLHAPTDGLLLDVTVNAGRVWVGAENSPDYTSDVNRTPGASVIADAGRLPLANDCARALVYDPPHIPNAGHSSKRLAQRFGTEKKTAATGYLFSDLHRSVLREAVRVLKPDGVVLAKICDIVHNHAYQWALVDFIKCVRECGLTPCDLVIRTKPWPSMKDPRWKRQSHTRRAHSYWAVSRLGRCEPKRRGTA